MSRKKWTKKRHTAVFAILRGIFRPYTKIKYNYTAVKTDLKGPCLVMCNHTTTMDPFFLSLSFKRPVYFFTSDDLFNIKGVSSVIRYLVAPIPKSKSLSDMQAVKSCLRILREGGIVAVFPEGNRTLSGGQWEITDAVAKIAKLCKVPLVLYNIEGGYGADPRWGLKPRKGKMKGYVKRVISPQECKEKDVDELFGIIRRELDVSPKSQGDEVRFKSKRRAENIERVLYRCPCCGAVGSIKSRKSNFKCESCGRTWEYTENLSIMPPEPFGAIKEWHDWEKNETLIAAERKDGVIFTDGGIEFFESVRFKRKNKLDGRVLNANGSGLTVEGKKGGAFYPFEEMDGFTIVGKRKFNFYYRGKTYQIKGDKKFCALKYLHLYEGVQYV